MSKPEQFPPKPEPELPLPDSWVERIWTDMRTSYGSAFDRQWECPVGVDPVVHVAAMKETWAKQLGSFQKYPGAIAFALENLPARQFPPTLPEFKALCRQWNRPADRPALPAPPRQVPMQFVEAFKRLAEPHEDTSPERVRVARRYVAMFSQPGKRLSVLQAATLEEKREVVALYESQLAAAAQRQARGDSV